VGMGGLGVTLLIALGLVITRLSGITTLGPWGVAALFWALVSAVAGISIFALGATFNYLVALFYKRPIRQGLFGKPLMKNSLDRSFGWMGAVGLLAGLIVAGIALALGIQGWEITRLWLYLLGSSLFILVGIQLILYWILMRVLEELSTREIIAAQELTPAPERQNPSDLKPAAEPQVS